MSISTNHKWGLNCGPLLLIMTVICQPPFPPRLGSYLTAGRTYIRFSFISRQIQVCEWRSTGKPFLKSVNGFFPSCQSIASLESCYLPEHMLSKFGGIPIWEEVPIYLLKLFHTQLAIWTILQEPLVPVI